MGIYTLDIKSGNLIKIEKPFDNLVSLKNGKEFLKIDWDTTNKQWEGVKKKIYELFGFEIKMSFKDLPSKLKNIGNFGFFIRNGELRKLLGMSNKFKPFVNNIITVEEFLKE